MPASRLAGRTWRELGLPPEQMVVAEAQWDHVLRTGASVSDEVEFPSVDGLRTFEYQIDPVEDVNGTIAVILIAARDVTARRRAETSLRDSEDRYRRAVTTAALPILLHAEDGEVLAVSDGLLVSTGYSRERLRRFKNWAGVGLPRPGRGDWQFANLGLGLAAARASGGRSLPPVCRRQRRHGLQSQPNPSAPRRSVIVAPSPPSMESCTTGTATFVDGRAVLLVGTVTDETARKAVDQELRDLAQQRDRLLQELHHRVKNNLQPAGSLLKLQATRTGSPAPLDFVALAEPHILATGARHDILSRGDGSGSVELASYVRELCRQLSASYLDQGAQVRLDVDTATPLLGIDRAVPLGLVITELVTNAFRHDFAGGAFGQVKVKMRAIADGRWRLSVGDDGSGSARPASRE